MGAMTASIAHEQIECAVIIESELARILVEFGSDTVADDGHHRISPKKIIALAMNRLEARGKGI
jgi:hypothetical protein